MVDTKMQCVKQISKIKCIYCCFSCQNEHPMVITAFMLRMAEMLVQETGIHRNEMKPLQSLYAASLNTCKGFKM